MIKRSILNLVQATLDDAKAIDVAWLDVRELTSVTDDMIICTGRSSRHVKSIADRIIKAAKDHQHQPHGIEGYTQGEWILIDLVDMIIHVMQPEKREFYDLESLWTDPKAAANQS